MKYLLGLGLIVVGVGIGAYIWLPQPVTMQITDGSLPRYKDFEQKEFVVDSGFGTIYYCPKFEMCSIREEQKMYLPKDVEIRGYQTVLRHSPPIPLGDEWKRQADFQNFYLNDLKSRGFVSGDIAVPAYGGHFEFGQYEKQSQITTEFGRVKNGELEVVVVQTSTEDSSDCPDSEKNIFDGCNVNAGEYYRLYIYPPVPLKDILSR